MRNWFSLYQLTITLYPENLCLPTTHNPPNSTHIMGLPKNGETATVTVDRMPNNECLTMQLQHLHYLHHHQQQLVTHQCIQVQPLHTASVQQQPPKRVAAVSFDMRQNLRQIIVQMFSKTGAVGRQVFFSKWSTIIKSNSEGIL